MERVHACIYRAPSARYITTPLIPFALLSLTLFRHLQLRHARLDTPDNLLDRLNNHILDRRRCATPSPCNGSSSLDSSIDDGIGDDARRGVFKVAGDVVEGSAADEGDVFGEVQAGGYGYH